MSTPASKIVLAEQRKAKREKLELELALQLSASGVHGWVREHEFHPTRKWRFDFAFVSVKLAIEVEGITYDGGRHQRLDGYQGDVDKYNAAIELGWVVYRVTAKNLKAGTVPNAIAKLYRRRWESIRHEFNPKR